MTTRSLLSRSGRGAVAIALSAVVLAGCGSDEPETDGAAPADDETVASGEVDDVDRDDIEDLDDYDGDIGLDGEPGLGDADVIPIEEVVANVELYDGEALIVSGQVDEVLQDGVFTISGSDADASGVLVLHTGTTEVAEADDVRITGVLDGGFDTALADAAVGMDIPEASVERYAGDPYVVTDEVEVVEAAR